MVLCECGCGLEVKEGNRFIRGHWRRGIKHTDSAKKTMGGFKGRHHSVEAKRSMSKAHKGNQHALGNKIYYRTEVLEKLEAR